MLDHAAVVASVTYKPGWALKLGGPGGRFLCVMARTPDSWRPASERHTQHMFELPDDVVTHRAFARWVFDRLLLCELHEAGEFFDLDGFRPFYPHHQGTGSPYVLVDRWEDPDGVATDQSEAPQNSA